MGRRRVDGAVVRVVERAAAHGHHLLCVAPPPRATLRQALPRGTCVCVRAAASVKKEPGSRGGRLVAYFTL